MQNNKPKPLPVIDFRDIARFWAKVDKTPGHGPKGECWVWTAAANDRGYGVFEFPAATTRANRVAYAIQTGVDPHPHLVLHSCDNPSCQRGEHLFLGDETLNAIDASIKGRLAFSERNGSRLYPEKLKRGSAHAHAKLTESQVQELRLAYTDGATCTALAAQYAVAMSTVARIVKGIGWAHAGGDTNPTPLQRKGSSHYSTKLTEQNVRDIRRKREEGRTLQSLADEYGMTTMPIGAICRRKTWKHVSD